MYQWCEEVRETDIACRTYTTVRTAEDNKERVEQTWNAGDAGSKSYSIYLGIGRNECSNSRQRAPHKTLLMRIIPKKKSKPKNKTNRNQQPPQPHTLFREMSIKNATMRRSTTTTKSTFSSLIFCFFLTTSFRPTSIATAATAERYNALPVVAFVSQKRKRSSFGNVPTLGTTAASFPSQSTPTRLYLEKPSNSTNGHYTSSSSTSSSTSISTSSKSRKSSTELDASFSATMMEERMNDLTYKIYCDLDGVLVDFEHGVQKLLNAPSSKLVKGTMWKHIARANAFYEDLPWTKDGKQLWNAIRHLGPDILTGVPYPKESRLQKYNWCKRELGVNEVYHVDMAAGHKDHEPVNGNIPKQGVTNVITCWSNNKYRECTTQKSILIDDRDSLRESWESAGGIFVHHVDAETTIQKLREHGILDENLYQ